MGTWCSRWLCGVGAVLAVSVPRPAVAQDFTKSGDYVEEARALVEKFRSAAPGDAQRALALQIAEKPFAKSLLKQPAYETLGATYYDLIKGERGIATEALARARQRLVAEEGWLPGLVEKIGFIENASSRALKKAPMDLDIGVVDAALGDFFKLTANGEIERLGSKGPGQLQDALERLFLAEMKATAKPLEAAAKNLGLQAYGLTRKSLLVSSTTAWHPEAYAWLGVLEAGGVAPVGYLQQTADVTRYKLRELLAEFASGTNEEKLFALTEMARASLKDVPKLEAALKLAEGSNLSGITLGGKPVLGEANRDLIAALKAIDRGDITMQQFLARAEMSPQKFVESVERLMDNMDAAIRFQPPAVRARLYATYKPASAGKVTSALVSDVIARPTGAVLEYEEAVRRAGIRLGELGPDVLSLDESLARLAGTRLVSVDQTSTAQFLRRMLAGEKYATSFTKYDEVLDVVLQEIDLVASKDYAVLFGPKYGEVLFEAHMTLPPVKRGIMAKRLAMSVGGAAQVEATEKGTEQLLGAGSKGGATTADRVGLGIQSVVSLAIGISNTVDVLERNRMANKETTTREIVQVWLEALPFLGELTTGTNDFEVGLAEGDTLKMFEGGLNVLAGIAYLVPGAQIPVLVGTLTVGVAAGGSALYASLKAAQEDRALINTWVESGQFGEQSCRFEGLTLSGNKFLPIGNFLTYDNGKSRFLVRDQATFDALYTNGVATYHTGPFAGVHIRETLVNAIERLGFKQNPNVQTSVTALTNMYPDLDVSGALHMASKTGENQIRTWVRDRGGSQREREVAVFIYHRVDQLYAEAAKQVLSTLMNDSQKAYEALMTCGDAQKAYADLAALEVRLGVKLKDRLDEMEKGFLASAARGMTWGWEKHSVGVRRVEKVKEYVRGYTLIARQIDGIRKLFVRYGVTAPDSFHLSGYLRIDATRIDSLFLAYQKAFGQAEQDAAALIAASGKKDPAHQCWAVLLDKLVRMQAGIVLTTDQYLLARQWAGARHAAFVSRDAEERKLLNSIEKDKPVLASVWMPFERAWEDAFAIEQLPTQMPNLPDYEANAAGALARLNTAYGQFVADPKQTVTRECGADSAPPTEALLPGTWTGTWENSRTWIDGKKQSGVATVSLSVDAKGVVTGSDDGNTIENGRRTGDTMTWTSKTSDGWRRWETTVQIKDGGNTLEVTYTGHDKETMFKDGGTYTGRGTYRRK